MNALRRMAIRLGLLIFGRQEHQVVLIGEPGAAKTVTLAGLYEFLGGPEPTRGESARMGPVDFSVQKVAQRIRQGKYPLKTSPGASEGFVLDLEWCRLNVVCPSGEWLANPQTGDNDPEARLWDLRAAHKIVLLNWAAINDSIAKLAIKGLTAKFQSDDLGYALPDAVRAAVWVLYGIDIMPAAKTEARDPKELKNEAATRLVQAAFATFEKYSGVVLRPTADGTSTEYAVGAVAAADRTNGSASDITAVLDDAFEQLAKHVVAAHTHLPMLIRFIRETLNITVLFTHADLVPSIVGVTSADLDQLLDALIGPPQELPLRPSEE